MAQRVPPKQIGNPSPSLNEIIYSDNDIIASLDSQHRGGTAQLVNLEESETETTNDSLGVSAILKGEIGSGTQHTNRLVRTVSPHDATIVNLVSELGIHQNKETESFSNGQLVLLKGTVRLFDSEHMKNLVKAVQAFGTLNSMMETKYTEGDDVADFMVGMTQYEFMMASLDIMPQVPLFVLQLRNAYRYSLPLQKTYLRYPMDILNWIYGAGLKGEWSVLGVFNSNREEPKKGALSTFDVLQTMGEAVPDILEDLGLPSKIITPILIYRALTIK